LLLLFCCCSRRRRRLPALSKEGSVERDYLDHINSAQNNENGELDVLYEQIADVLAIKCQPWFRQFAGTPKPNRSLYEIIGRPTIRLQMTSHGGESHVVLRDGDGVSSPSPLPRTPAMEGAFYWRI
jgi:hypothetical protein